MTDSAPTHTDDYPCETDEDAILAAAALVAGARNELAKMQSECLCWPNEWDDGEIVDDAPFRNADEALQETLSAILDIAREQTDLETYYEPSGEQAKAFMEDVVSD
jgi:hypothetical protein